MEHLHEILNYDFLILVYMVINTTPQTTRPEFEPWWTGRFSDFGYSSLFDFKYYAILFVAPGMVITRLDHIGLFVIMVLSW